MAERGKCRGLPRRGGRVGISTLRVMAQQNRNRDEQMGERGQGGEDSGVPQRGNFRAVAREGERCLGEGDL